MSNRHILVVEDELAIQELMRFTLTQAGYEAIIVESAEQATKLVASAKYPPVGRRGAAFGVAHDDYTGGDIMEKIRSANTETLLIAQIETAAGLENVEEIAAVEGVDVLGEAIAEVAAQ